MFKIGDIVGWQGLWQDYWKVVRLDALGFEVIRVSTIMSSTRRFLVKSKVKRYWKNSDSHCLTIKTKKDVQTELDIYINNYEKFMETMP